MRGRNTSGMSRLKLPVWCAPVQTAAANPVQRRRRHDTPLRSLYRTRSLCLPLSHIIGTLTAPSTSACAAARLSPQHGRPLAHASASSTTPQVLRCVNCACVMAGAEPCLSFFAPESKYRSRWSPRLCPARRRWPQHIRSLHTFTRVPLSTHMSGTLSVSIIDLDGISSDCAHQRARVPARTHAWLVFVHNYCWKLAYQYTSNLYLFGSQRLRPTENLSSMHRESSEAGCGACAGARCSQPHPSCIVELYCVHSVALLNPICPVNSVLHKLFIVHS